MATQFGKQHEWQKKPVDPKLLRKYDLGIGVNKRRLRNAKSVYHRSQIENKEKRIKFAEEESARAEILLTERSGQLQPKYGYSTSEITQAEIKNAVDITSAKKSFSLDLDMGPYKFCYSQNGRHLMLGGKKGHLAAFDWLTKKLHFEVNVMESVHDVCWLHNEQMMAAAQKEYVFVYDHQGIELHCLKRMNRTIALDFLPYHLLLCAASTENIYWLDVSLGKEMHIAWSRKNKSIMVMKHNPYNAVLCCGHAKGVVSMWTPNCKEPVATVLCHPYAVRQLAFDPYGRYMVTSGTGAWIKLWDARQLSSCLCSYRVSGFPSNLAFSQKKLLAVSTGNTVDVFRDVTLGESCSLYMTHKCPDTVTDLGFCPHEDILGVSTHRGFSSLIIPGSGEANYDAFESDPFIGKSGRKEGEIKSLLNKIPAELITLDPKTVMQVDTPTLEEKLKIKEKLEYIKVPKVDLVPRYRMKGKSGSSKVFKRKQQMREDFTRQFLQEAKIQQELLMSESLQLEGVGQRKVVPRRPENVLGRFKPKMKLKRIK